MVQERCFWYRNDGTPYKHVDGTQGCDRPRCIYAHPAVPRQWNSAIPASSRPSRRLLAVEERTRSHSRSSRRLRDRSARVRSSSRTRSSYSPRRRGRSHSRERRRKSGGRARASSPASSSPRATRRSRSREHRRDRHSADSSERRPHRLPLHRSYASYQQRDLPSHDGSVRGRSLSPLHHPLRLSRGAELAQDAQMLHYQDSPNANRDPVPARSIPTGPRKRTIMALPASVPHGHVVNPRADASAAHRKSPPIVSNAADSNGEAKGLTEDEVNLPEESSNAIKAVAKPVPLEVTLVRSISPPHSAPPPPSLPPPPLPSPPASTTSVGAFLPPPPPQPIWLPLSSVAQPDEDSVPDSKDELTLEEKHKIWGERIDLLVSASRIRTEHRLLEDETQGYTRIVASPAFTVLPPSERTAVEAKVSDAKARRDAKAEELKDVLFSLAESDYWPFNVLPKLKPEPSAVVTPDLMMQFSNLKDAVGQLHGLLYAVSARVDAPPAGTVKEDKSVENGMSSKRRRREEGADTVDLLPNASNNVVQRKELEELHSQLSSFEDRLSNLESAFFLHEDDVRDEIHVLLEERAEESKSDSKVQELEKDWNATGEQVKELLREMRELKLRTETVNKENAHLKLEVAALTQHIEELNIQQETEMDRMHREIIDLRAVIHTHLSCAPIPAPPLDLDALLTTVRPILVRSIRDELEPMLLELKLAVQDTLRVHSKELAEAIIPKLHMAVQAAETIRAWADRIGAAGIVDVQAHPKGHRAH